MDKKNLKRELNGLFRSMNYIADNYLSKRRAAAKEREAFYRIYRQLGLLWDFLGSFCKHRDGYKKNENKFFCKICGKARGQRKIIRYRTSNVKNV